MKKQISFFCIIFFFCLLIIIPHIFAETSKTTLPKGFVYLDEVLLHAQYDSRYYSNNNFIGKTINGYHSPRIILSKEATDQLLKAEQELLTFGLALLIFDGYRPQEAVDHFVKWAEDLSDTLNKSKYYPDINKSDLFSLNYIATKSSHSRGSTIDVSLFDIETQTELDMGSPFDYFGEISHHLSDNITLEQSINRTILSTIMSNFDFLSYPEEWWHYTLIDEPYTDTYFNFYVK